MAKKVIVFEVFVGWVGNAMPTKAGRMLDIESTEVVDEVNKFISVPPSTFP